MKISEKEDNVFECEFTEEEVNFLISFAVNKIVKDKIEEIEEGNSQNAAYRANNKMTG